MSKIPLALLCCLLASCAANHWSRYQVTGEAPEPNPPLGKGLEGRQVDGKTVYTVIVRYVISKEGRVTHAEIDQTDAPQRLQWAALKGVRRFQFNPAPQEKHVRQTMTFSDLKVEPD